MLQLRTSKLRITSPASLIETGRRRILRVTRNENRPKALRHNELLITDCESLPSGFAAYGTFRASLTDAHSTQYPIIYLPEELSYLEPGDILAIDATSGGLFVLYRRNSKHNSLLMTEQCNHYCLMCSQPPKRIDDSWLIEEIKDAIPLISPETEQIGITGGEPTLLEHQFITVIKHLKSYLPHTAVHILSNGRKFSDEVFTRTYTGIGHPNSIIGIPLYSDISDIHDYIVQSDGAYDETIRGVLNLKKLGNKVELRVVIHRQNYDRLPHLAEFISRNLMMVDHVALMGLEITGFTRANMPILWIDPWQYRKELEIAVDIFSNNRMNISIYNHPLCILPKSVWSFARKSISDWKNEYLEVCNSCTQREQCGGFFASAVYKKSEHIKAFQ